MALFCRGRSRAEADDRVGFKVAAYLFLFCVYRSAQAARVCNVDERTANLTLLGCLNRVPLDRKNLSENIVLAHLNRIPVSCVIGRRHQQVWCDGSDREIS